MEKYNRIIRLSITFGSIYLMHFGYIKRMIGIYSFWISVALTDSKNFALTLANMTFIQKTATF